MGGLVTTRRTRRTETLTTSLVFEVAALRGAPRGTRAYVHQDRWVVRPDPESRRWRIDRHGGFGIFEAVQGLHDLYDSPELAAGALELYLQRGSRAAREDEALELLAGGIAGIAARLLADKRTFIATPDATVAVRATI